MKAYSQMMLLEYQTKCKRRITVGEALRLLSKYKGVYYNELV